MTIGIPRPGQGGGASLVLRRAGRWLFRLRGSPEAIARGVAIGVFVAFTPTGGVQVLIALVLATLLGANRPAAVAPVFITNPITAVPAFTLTYWVGSLMLPGPSLAEARLIVSQLVEGLKAHGLLDLKAQFASLLSMGHDILMILLVGGLAVGLALAIPSYGLTLWTVRHHRARRDQRRKPRSPT